MQTGDIVEITPTYFNNNPNLKEIMDPKNRVYLGLVLQIDKNNYFIPFRTNAPTGPQYKKCIFPIPSTVKQLAGLDFRKALIVNDTSYIKVILNPRLPNSQLREITNNLTTIENMFTLYVKRYYRVVKKDRVAQELDYKYSTLQNFHTELGIF